MWSQQWNVKFSIHYALKNSNWCRPFSTYSGPNMKFYWVLWAGFKTAGPPIFLNEWCRWLSSCTVVSSVQITSQKPLLTASVKLSQAHIKRLILFCRQISWQYFDPLKVHPNIERQRMKVENEIEIPRAVRSLCIWVAVVSSKFFMPWSTIYLTWGWSFQSLLSVL